MERAVDREARARDEADYLRAQIEEARGWLRRLYAHYVGPVGMGSGTGLTLSKFRRLLRDGGLLAEDPDDVGRPSTSLSPFEQPPIDMTDADLLHATAAGEHGCNLSEVAFEVALTDCAESCYAGTTCRSREECFLKFCGAVIYPMIEMLPSGLLVEDAVRLMADPDAGVSALLRRSKVFLEGVFEQHAVGKHDPDPSYRKGHWTVQIASRWAMQANLFGDGPNSMSRQVLQQVFAECTAHAASSGAASSEFKLSSTGFFLFLVALAQNAYRGRMVPPLVRVAAFVLFIGGVTTAANKNKLPPAWAKAALEAVDSSGLPGVALVSPRGPAPISPRPKSTATSNLSPGGYGAAAPRTRLQSSRPVSPRPAPVSVSPRGPSPVSPRPAAVPVRTAESPPPAAARPAVCSRGAEGGYPGGA